MIVLAGDNADPRDRNGPSGKGHYGKHRARRDSGSKTPRNASRTHACLCLATSGWLGPACSYAVHCSEWNIYSACWGYRLCGDRTNSWFLSLAQSECGAVLFELHRFDRFPFLTVVSLSRRMKIMLAFPLLAILSAAWSPDPVQSVVSGEISLIFTVFAIYVASTIAFPEDSLNSSC